MWAGGGTQEEGIFACSISATKKPSSIAGSYLLIIQFVASALSVGRDFHIDVGFETCFQACLASQLIS